MKIGIVGGGWAGMAAAVEACGAGHAVSVFEAARQWGGRARSLPARLPDGREVLLDNGQHILIGAYTETLALMARVGVDAASAFERLPLALRFPDGGGLALPRLPHALTRATRGIGPLDVLVGVLRARGWDWRDRGSLLRTASRWQRQGFRCGERETVAALCASLSPRVRAELTEPLCLSALNTAPEEASGATFLRVLRDALFETPGGSELLLPRCDLGALFPVAADAWLRAHGARTALGRRVRAIERDGTGWRIDGEPFDRVLLACAPWDAARLATGIADDAATAWAASAAALRHEAITTVYLHAEKAALPAPILALRSGAGAPAQFVFDRARLGGPPGLLAFVISASRGEREALQDEVLAQARSQLRIDGLQPVATVVERRATFACTPGLVRPAQQIAAGLLACGDYVEGPYPATLEGAVRNAQAAVAAL